VAADQITATAQHKRGAAEKDYSDAVGQIRLRAEEEIRQIQAEAQRRITEWDDAQSRTLSEANQWEAAELRRVNSDLLEVVTEQDRLISAENAALSQIESHRTEALGQLDEERAHTTRLAGQGVDATSDSGAAPTRPSQDVGSPREDVQAEAPTFRGPEPTSGSGSVGSTSGAAAPDDQGPGTTPELPDRPPDIPGSAVARPAHLTVPRQDQPEDGADGLGSFRATGRLVRDQARRLRSWTGLGPGSRAHAQGTAEDRRHRR